MPDYVKKPLRREDSLVVTQTAYPTADILAEIGRVTIAAARVDRYMAMALDDFPDKQDDLTAMLTWRSGKLQDKLIKQLQKHFAGRLHFGRANLLAVAVEAVEEAHGAIEQRHKIIHAIWSLSPEAARVPVSAIMDAESQDEIDRLLSREVASPTDWTTLHPKSGMPGLSGLAELESVRARLENANLTLRNLRHELWDARRSKKPGRSTESRVRPLAEEEHDD